MESLSLPFNRHGGGQLNLKPDHPYAPSLKKKTPKDVPGSQDDQFDEARSLC